MKKVFLQTCLVLAIASSSIAHAAYADLTAFTDGKSNEGVTLSSNLVTLTETTISTHRAKFGHSEFGKNSQPLPIYSFEYIRSGVEATASLSGNFGSVVLDAPIGVATTYTFRSPNSGSMYFGVYGVQSGSNLLGTSTLTLRNFSTNAAIVPVPEPETYSMLLVGLGLMGAITRRRCKSRGELLAV